YKMVYVFDCLLFILTGALSLTAASPLAFYIIAVCMGGMYAVQRVGDANMVFELAPPEQTSRFIGINNTFMAPILTIAPLVGGLIVDGLSHQALFATVLVVGIVALWLCIQYLPDPRKQALTA